MVSQMSLFERGRSERFSATWPFSGSMRNGLIWPRARPGSLMNADGSGSSPGAEAYPTPTAERYGSNRTPTEGAAVRPSLFQLAKNWPTPVVTDASSSARGTTTTGNMKDGVSLTDVIRAWPTPVASERANRTSKAAPSTLNGTHGRHLSAEAISTTSRWPTPIAADGIAGHRQYARGNESLGSAAQSWQTPMANGNRKLPDQATTWPTPAARDYRTPNSPEHIAAGRGQAHMGQLANAAVHGFPSSPPQDPAIEPSGIASSPSIRPSRQPSPAPDPDGPVLSPTFVEWLMAWPRGWSSPCPIEPTDYASWETEFRQWLAQLLSRFSGGECLKDRSER